jgi:hypothetical protein
VVKRDTVEKHPFIRTIAAESSNDDRTNEIYSIHRKNIFAGKINNIMRKDNFP